MGIANHIDGYVINHSIEYSTTDIYDHFVEPSTEFQISLLVRELKAKGISEVRYRYAGYNDDFRSPVRYTIEGLEACESMYVIEYACKRLGILYTDVERQ